MRKNLRPFLIFVDQVEHKQLRGPEVPEIRGIARAPRTSVRKPLGSREDPVPQALSADEWFRVA